MPAPYKGQQDSEAQHPRHGLLCALQRSASRSRVSLNSSDIKDDVREQQMQGRVPRLKVGKQHQLRNMVAQHFITQAGLVGHHLCMPCACQPIRYCLIIE